MREAMFYTTGKGNVVNCRLCYRCCAIPDGGWGFCGARQNQKGKLYAMTYGKAVACNVDPIEKKPFFHFWPGSTSFSVATVGCNFRCLHCFTPDTVVVTRDGAHPISEIPNKGEVRVLTHSGKMSQVKKWFRHPYAGKVVKIKPFFLPEIKCTPDHKIFVAEKPGSPISKVQAGKISKQHSLLVPKRARLTGSVFIDSVRLLKQSKPAPFRRGKKITPELFAQMKRMRVEGRTSKEVGRAFSLHPAYVRTVFSRVRRSGEEIVFLQDYPTKINSINGRVRFKNEKGKGVPAKSELTESLARLLGLYCAEGCVSKDRKRPNSFAVRFSFGKHEGMLTAETKELLESIFGVKAAIRHEPTALHVRCDSASLAAFFAELCGDNCLTKKVPPQMFGASKNVIGAFLKGYFDGDGCFKENYADAISISKKLILGVCELMLIQGVMPSYYEYVPPKEREILGRKVEQNPNYIVRVPRSFDFVRGTWDGRYKKTWAEDASYFYVPIRSISEEYYCGDVYNLEVEEDHSYTASFAAVCNCQNAEISQARPGELPEMDLLPEKIVELAKQNGCQGISYTYTEPTIFFEYCYDTGLLARKAGLTNSFVTNGYMGPDAVHVAREFLDAARVDLKGDARHYEKVCGGVKLDSVLECIRNMHKAGFHMEIITLVIPRDNDNREFVQEAASFLKGLDRDMPWHFTRFYPCHRMNDRPATPVETLEKMHDWAVAEGMNYVYIGNVPGHRYENTCCPKCGSPLIMRDSFTVAKVMLTKDKKCPQCGQKIPVTGEIAGSTIP